MTRDDDGVSLVSLIDIRVYYELGNHFLFCPVLRGRSKKNRPRGIYVNEDYSQRVMARRKELLPKMMKAQEEGKIAYLTFDKLVARERHDVANRD